MFSFIVHYALVLAPAAILAGIGMHVHAGRMLREMGEEGATISGTGR